MKTENRIYSLQKSQVSKTDAQVNLDLNTNKTENLNTINLYGVNISGIDPRLIREAQIHITIPMKAGHAKVIGIDRDAKINIAEDCVATLKLGLVRNEGMALALDYFSLEFSRASKN